MGQENAAGTRYTKNHEWARVDGDTVTVGITDFAQRQLTEIVFVELPQVGKKVEKSKPIAVIESVKSVSDVFAPVSGEVIEVNDKLLNSPEILNEDPCGKGWLIRMKVSDKNELDGLMTKEQYDEFMKKEGRR